MSERDSLAAQLRALTFEVSSQNVRHAMVQAAARLEVLEQEKVTHRWVQHSNSRDAESLAACQRELAIAQQPTFHPRCQDCGGDAPVDHAFATLGAPGGFLCVRCGSQALKLRAEAAEAERDRYRTAMERVSAMSLEGVHRCDVCQAIRYRAVTSLSPHKTP